MTDRGPKIARIAEYLEGRVVPNDRVDVSIKGIVLGFPASLEAFKPNFPFGLNYLVETKVIDDPSQAEEDMPFSLTLNPRFSKGIFAFLMRGVLFEARGQLLGNAKLDKSFLAKFNDLEAAQEFASFPGVQQTVQMLASTSHFTELIIKSDAGIYLSSPTSLDSVNSELCIETFKQLGTLGQILFDHFS